MKIYKNAFTLSEVIITIGIIGVVAALTLPILTENINELIYSTRQANIAYKVTQATDTMKSLGLLNKTYSSTDDFADELVKHLKVIKRCNSNNISACWPTDYVTTSEGEKYEVAGAKKGKNLNIKSNITDNVGLILADGAAIIMTYNQNSIGMDEGEPLTSSIKSLPIGFGRTREFAYTTSSTTAIDFVMDVNGTKGPNSETQNGKMFDIRSFRVARFSNGCAGQYVKGIGCVVNLGTDYECLINGTEDYNKWNPGNYQYNSCFGGAKKACNDIEMELADVSKMRSMCNAVKNGTLNLSRSEIWMTSSSIGVDLHSVFRFSDCDIWGGSSNTNKEPALCISE